MSPFTSLLSPPLAPRRLGCEPSLLFTGLEDAVVVAVLIIALLVRPSSRCLSIPNRRGRCPRFVPGPAPHPGPPPRPREAPLGEATGRGGLYMRPFVPHAAPLLLLRLPAALVLSPPTRSPPSTEEGTEEGTVAPPASCPSPRASKEGRRLRLLRLMLLQLLLRLLSPPLEAGAAMDDITDPASLTKAVAALGILEVMAAAMSSFPMLPGTFTTGKGGRGGRGKYEQL